MLPGNTQVLCGEKLKPITEIREEQIVSAAQGWSEMALTRVKDVYINYDATASLVKITTAKGVVLRCTPEQMCFARLNPAARQYTLYLHERSNVGFRLGLATDLMRELLAMNSLKQDLFNQAELKDKIWLIETTQNLPAASFMLKLAVFKYGLPDIYFSSSSPKSEFSNRMIREIFNEIDTPSRAYKLLRDCSMFVEHPHIVMRICPRQKTTSSAINFVIFGGTEKNASSRYSHLIQIAGASDINRAEHAQFKRKQSKHGLWFLEITRDDIEEAELFVKTLSHLDNLDIVKKIQLTKKAPFYILPASHIKCGMLVPILNDKHEIVEDTVVSCETEEYGGPLYSLQIKSLRNYAADSMIVMCYNPLKPIAQE